MKRFLFRVSRVISVVFIIPPIVTLMIAVVNQPEFAYVLVVTVPGLLVPIAINWLFFGKLSLWISKEVSE